MGVSIPVKQTHQVMTLKNLIQATGYLVVCQKTCSFSLLQNRLLIDEKTTSQVLSIIEGLGIISWDGSQYIVGVKNIEELEKVLDILFENHRKRFHDK
jgi:hypothetical protein